MASDSNQTDDPETSTEEFSGDYEDENVTNEGKGNRFKGKGEEWIKRVPVKGNEEETPDKHTDLGEKKYRARNKKI